MAFRVFVSAVSKELGGARLEVARVLRRKGIDVTDQAHFRQGGGVLLEKLRDEIERCDAVVCLVGDHPGEGPTAEHARALGQNDLFDRYAAATGTEEASYTQWEFLLAKTFGKATYVFIAEPTFPRGSEEGKAPPAPSTNDQDRQARFIAWLKQTGEDRDPFATPAALLEDVLVLAFPDTAMSKPRSARFPPLRSVRKPPQERLLAVMAFDNLSPDPELTFFSDGVSEEIQQTVAKGSSLKVVARSSSFQFRGADKATRKVAAELKATHLLDGSVRRGGSRVRVSAHLVECASESTLWTDRFEGDLSDIFALQDRIAEAVARALKVALEPPATAAPLDPPVYETFLRARSTITEGSRLFDESAAEATPLLEQVVHSASDFAPAWGLLAYARAWTLRAGHRRWSYAKGRAGVVEAAATALRLDPRRVDAYLAQAMLEPWGAYGAREKLLKQALEVAPNEPGALAEMSTFCWSVGRFRDALRFAEQACELNPLMPATRLQVAQMRAYVGDLEASIRMHQELRQRWPNNAPILLSLLNFALGFGFWDAYDDAIGDIAAFEGWQGSDLRATQAFAETLRSGDPSRRDRRLQRYTELVDKTGTLPLNLVESLSYLGLVDEAFALADRASFAHVFDPDGPLPSAAFPGVILGRRSPLNKTLRFIRLCDRLGLCAYWTQSGCWPDCVEWTPYDFKAEVRQVSA
ncbi:MAG: DUF4062 domain-containing protein [Anaerolineaceae bacterium]